MKLAGWQLDHKGHSGTHTSWRKARNIAIGRYRELFENERGFNVFSQTYPTDKTPIGGIALKDEEILWFSVDETNYRFDDINLISASEIGITDKFGNYTTLIKDKKLNFRHDKHITGEVTYNHKNEPIVPFTDYYNNPRLINPKNIPFELNPDKSLVNPDDIVLLNLFPHMEIPDIILIEVNDGGGNLKSGAYYIIPSYELKDGTVTNWLDCSNPITITDDSKSVSYNNYDGAEAGTNTNKSITVDFTNIDTRFKYLRLAIVKKIGGAISQFEFKRISITGSTMRVTYTGTEVETPLDSTEVFADRLSFDRIKAFTNLQDSLVGANVHTKRDLDYQKYANNIKVEWVYDEFPIALDGIKGSYKDEVIIFDKRAFPNDEIVALYINFLLKDGNKSYGYHIPGRLANAGDRDLLTNVVPYIQDYAIAPNVRKFHTRNTATTGAEQLMGYWENENEFYPNNDNFDIWESDGNGGGQQKSIGETTLRGKNVRHHKLPSHRQLELWGNKIATNNNGAGGTVTLSNAGMYDTTPQLDNLKFDTAVNTTNSGTLSDFNKKYKALIDHTVTLNIVDLQIIGYVTLDGQLPNVRIQVVKRNINGTISSVLHDSGVQTGNASITVNLAVPLLAGESVHIIGQVYIDTPDQLGQLSIASVNSLTFTASNYTVGGSIFTSPLGIKLSNIYIPDEIKDQIIGYEISYGERTFDNMTVYGQSILFHNNWHNTYDLNGKCRFHAFEILDMNPSLGVTHITPQLIVSDDGTGNFLQNATIDNMYSGNFPVELEVIKVDKSEVILNNNSIQNNVDSETHLGVTLNATLLNQPNDRVIVNLCGLKKDVYSSFDAQNLVSTGKIFRINDIESTYKTDALYNGDVFLTPYGIRLTNSASEKVFWFLCQSVHNIGLRHEGDLWYQKYYPKTNPLTLVPPGGEDVKDYTNYIAYNRDYSSLNNLNLVIPLPIDHEEVEHLSNLIIRSPRNSNNDRTPKWRIFNVNDFYYMPRTHGVIFNIEAYNEVLLIQTENALYKTVGNKRLNAEGFEINLGSGDIFAIEPEVVIADDGGYIGTKSQLTTFVNKSGVFMLDSIKGKVFIISGKINEISNAGLSVHLEEVIPLKFASQLEDLLGKGFTFDAPQSPCSVGYFAVYDDFYKRVLLVKNDFVIKDVSKFKGQFVSGTEYNPGDIVLMEDNTLGYIETYSDTLPSSLNLPPIVYRRTYVVGLMNYYVFAIERTNTKYVKNESMTISYSILDNLWVCEHDYHPDFILHTRNNVISCKSRKLYKHNIKGVKGKYYGDTIYPSYIDMLFNFDNQDTKYYITAVWQSEIRKLDNTNVYDKTLTHIALYTDRHCTGLIDIRNNRKLFFGNNVAGVEGHWNFNDFHNMVLDKNSPFINENGDIITSNIANQKAWFDKGKIYGKYAVLRLQYDNVEQLELYLHQIDMLIKKSDR